METSLVKLVDQGEDVDQHCDGLEAEDAAIHSMVKDFLDVVDNNLKCDIKLLTSELA